MAFIRSDARSEPAPGSLQQRPARSGTEHVIGGTGHPTVAAAQVGRQRDAGGALPRRQRFEQLGM
jgi:hypothetical protein